MSVDTDLRLSALVSLIKAAHLSLFSLLGYRYALSQAGHFIGYNILGKFYREGIGFRTKADVQKIALEFFREFRHMVRPLQLDTTPMEGTLVDGEITFCASSSGFPWGLMVFVKTGDLRNVVILPFSEEINGLVTYIEFLQNDHENIHVQRGRFEGDLERWRINPTLRPMKWMKSQDMYPSSI